jgi:DNA-directed RNA polymerase specialized sigma24 family protein
VSEVFLDVWRQAESFESKSQVSTWLLAIARYKALSALRRRTDEHLDDNMAATIEDTADNPEVVTTTRTATRSSKVSEPAFAGAPRSHRPRILSREVGGRSRADRRGCRPQP